MSKISLHLDPARLFRWHLWLIEALTAVPGCEVSVKFCGLRQPLPSYCKSLFEFERLVYRLKGQHALDPVPQSAFPVGSDESALIINLAGTEPAHATARVLTPCFNGIVGEIGAMAILFDAATMSVEIHDSAQPVPWTATPALVAHDIFTCGLDNLLSSAIGLILKAISEKQPAQPASIGSPARVMSAPQTIMAAVNAFAHRSLQYLYTRARGGTRWAIGWRIVENPFYNLLDRRVGAFSILRDDRRRFYADPFPFVHNGRYFVFVEEYPFATGRGCISVAEIKDGKIGTPRPVLEEPYHLSYPFVFKNEGQIWMIPEAGESNGIYLYRAVDFPYRWQRAGCLLDGICAFDSTILQQPDGLWLFVCERIYQSSSYDRLSLFHADKLTGYWSPHQCNPVLFDAALSRPAGAFIRRNGAVLRPTQDCSRSYGGRVIVSSLETLCMDKFVQKKIGTIDCGGFGCHTYNEHSGLEVIDCFGPTRGLRRVQANYIPDSKVVGFREPVGQFITPAEPV